MQDIVIPTLAHPKVCKKIATSERLERLAPKLAKSFWKIDTELQNLSGVKVKYGGKNFVRYRARADFAEAVIYPGAIQGRITMNQGARLERDCDLDVAKVLGVLRKAYDQSC